MKRLLIVLAGISLLAPAAHAQTGRHVSVGLGVGAHSFADKDFHVKSPGMILVDRLTLKPGGKEGWSLGPKATVDWSSIDVRASDVSGAPRVGKLRSIPLMVGFGPNYRHDRTSVSISFLGGPSFNKFTPDAGIGSVHTKTSVQFRPGIGVWYDISSRLGVHTGVHYTINRVTATPSDSTVAGGKWKTDNLSVSAGFAIGLF